jgi:hypothetical protein
MPRQFAVSAAVIDTASRQCWLLDCTPDFKDQHHALRQYLGMHMHSSDCDFLQF